MDLDPYEIAEKIKKPVDKWPGRCHEIAADLLDTGLLEPGAELRYGHWLGPVHPKCPVACFYQSHQAGLLFQRHGWVQLVDQRVVDPTRWVFEAAEPYIYAGPNDHYDIGGNHLRMSLLGPPPRFVRREDLPPEERNATSAVFLRREDFDPEAWIFIRGHFFHDSPYLTGAQALWLASLDPRDLDEHCRTIYETFISRGLRGMIPIDNVHWVLGRDAY